MTDYFTTDEMRQALLLALDEVTGPNSRRSLLGLANLIKYMSDSVEYTGSDPFTHEEFFAINAALWDMFGLKGVNGTEEIPGLAVKVGMRTAERLIPAQTLSQLEAMQHLAELGGFEFTDAHTLTLSDCPACSRAYDLTRTVEKHGAIGGFCSTLVGFIKGGLAQLTGDAPPIVREVACIQLGKGVCRFQVDYGTTSMD